ncbi:unnamed protein product [Amoebophrya sp. A120]|nr:unnamed protein product [Amoebophrya sp. A120]|eukprot:GSA120T00005337001.1
MSSLTAPAAKMKKKTKKSASAPKTAVERPAVVTAANFSEQDPLPLRNEKQVKKSFSSGNGSKPDIKLSRKLKRTIRVESKAETELEKRDAVLRQENAGGLMEADPEVFGEKTLKVRQDEILDSVDIGTQAKAIDLALPFGDYSVSYTPSGRHMVLAGSKGHVSLLDTQSLSTACELKLKESVRCAQSFHNDNLFAVSQKKCCFVYDRNGMEIHKMKEHSLVHQMEFLRYHFLLVTGSEFGDIRYHDIATGQGVAHLRTKKGPVKCLRQNKQTAVMHCGQANGVVSLWTPTIKEPCMKILAHKGPVDHLDFYRDHYMVSSGGDGRWKIFDLRKPAEPVLSQSYYGCPVTSIDVSQTGLLAFGMNKKVQVFDSKIWNSAPEMLTTAGTNKVQQPMKKLNQVQRAKRAEQQANLPALTATRRAAEPYMQQTFPGKFVQCVRFQPFQDVLSVGTSAGLSQLLVPGAGHAFFDSYGANPYETKTQKREREVHMLLDKVPHDMIVFNPAFDSRGTKHLVGNFKKQNNSTASSSAAASSTSTAAPSTGTTSEDKKSKSNDWLGSHELDNSGKIVNVKSTTGEDDSDVDSEEEFEQTGIRLTRGKKKMRGKNKIGKRLKKKEVAKGEEKREGTRKVKRKKAPSVALDRTVDVKSDGALARFKKKKRRMDELE